MPGQPGRHVLQTGNWIVGPPEQRQKLRYVKRRIELPGGGGSVAAPLENLSIRGLMTMPPWFEDPEESRPYFRELRELPAAGLTFA